MAAPVAEMNKQMKVASEEREAENHEFQTAVSPRAEGRAGCSTPPEASGASSPHLLPHTLERTFLEISQNL